MATMSHDNDNNESRNRKLDILLQHFADCDEAARFYTGFPYYSKFTCFYEFLLPSTNYCGLNNAEDRSSFEEKCGPRHILTNR